MQWDIKPVFTGLIKEILTNILFFIKLVYSKCIVNTTHTACKIMFIQAS